MLTARIRLLIASIVFIFLFTKQGFSPQNLGNSPLHCACLNGHTNVVRLLLEAQADLQIKNHVSVDLLVPCMGMGSYFTCH